MKCKGRAWWGRAVTQQVSTNLGKRGDECLRYCDSLKGVAHVQMLGYAMQQNERHASPLFVFCLHYM